MTFDYNEADTCRLYVTPKLREAGWEMLALLDHRAAHFH